MKPVVVCLDLEGVLVPEIWIAVAERTSIPELRLTTRDVANYDELMAHRLRTLDEHGLRLSDITDVIATLEPMPGALDFLTELRSRHQVIILSDTFAEFAHPLMRQLAWPTLFCHNLVVDDDRIVGYRLRMPDQKRSSVAALQGLNFTVLAAGDSNNDLTMLRQADAGVLYCPPQKVIEANPDLPVTWEYEALSARFDDELTRLAVATASD